ncbi:hypothetical protein [Rufibacter tibetensis]|uniref:Uncharacterized protein n=1 Tax=Rufibacter tibetensis TaxID=512763 RepID=A0A0P0CDD4_9BACT|nr:hypothetical protein [Rufibacter tibetensis]ALI99786.1 hypothetical protein DC20_13390 [Rufibacter tibetensis]
MDFKDKAKLAETLHPKPTVLAADVRLKLARYLYLCHSGTGTIGLVFGVWEPMLASLFPEALTPKRI